MPLIKTIIVWQLAHKVISEILIHINAQHVIILAKLVQDHQILVVLVALTTSYITEAALIVIFQKNYYISS